VVLGTFSVYRLISDGCSLGNAIFPKISPNNWVIKDIQYLYSVRKVLGTDSGLRFLKVRTCTECHLVLATASFSSTYKRIAPMGLMVHF
jgi:hypothetical protein